MLGGFGVIRLISRTSDRDLWMAAWGVAGALAMFRAAWVSIEALGQLWWRRLLRVLAVWGLIFAVAFFAAAALIELKNAAAENATIWSASVIPASNAGPSHVTDDSVPFLRRNIGVSCAISPSISAMAL